LQPKPAIIALSRSCIARGTGGSNPSPSSTESLANVTFGAHSIERTEGWNPVSSTLASPNLAESLSSVDQIARLPHPDRSRGVWGCAQPGTIAAGGEEDVSGTAIGTVLSAGIVDVFSDEVVNAADLSGAAAPAACTDVDQESASNLYNQATARQKSHEVIA
jgi:hypothetical protein